MSQPEPALPADPADPSPPSAASASAAIHLRPTAELAERVLLPGDPGRALALAQILIDIPRMFNHHRGLWGYTGPARLDGEPLTIQSTGMGGPSAAIVLTELIALGARRAVRVGTCGALAPGLALGELVIANEAICADGTSRALIAGEHAPTGDPLELRTAAHPVLADTLAQAAPAGSHRGAVVSVDLFYDDPPRPPRGGGAGALAIEMEAATLFALGARARVPVGCLLAISDTFDAAGARTHIDDHTLLSAAEAMGTAAVAALGSPTG